MSRTPALSRLWPLFFALTSLEGGLAFLALLRIPTESEHVSTTRLAFLLAQALVTVLALGLTFFSRDEDRRARYLDPNRSPRLSLILTLAFSLLALTSGLVLFLLRYADPERLLPLFERARPPLLFALALGAQTALFLLALRNGLHPAALKRRKTAYLAGGIAFAILLVLLLFVAATRLGLTPDPGYWAEPGVPVLGWQMGLALLGGLTVLLLGLRLSPSRRVDVLLPLLVYSLALVVWLSVPMDVLRNSFYSPIDPPTNQPLPYSDAGYYDYQAHSLLLGEGYVEDIPTRPLYIVFLAGLHALLGERYDLILAAQTALLALFPVVLYLLGRELHSRAAGVTVALLAIAREWVALMVASTVRVSNTRMLLTDLPTTLVIALAALLVTRSLARREGAGMAPLLAGGSFGLLLLLRTQAMLILPVVLLLALFAWRPRDRRARRASLLALALFLAGLLAPIAPWLTHNARLTGKLAFDAPDHLALLASQYTFDSTLDVSAFDFEHESLAEHIINFVRENPTFVAGFVANHFLATEIGGLLALPLVARYDGLSAPIVPYWVDWDGHLAWYNVLLVLLYLALIGLGLGAAWARLRWAGLTPLAFNLGYALSNGLARFSGWRYDLPADWVPYFYFGLGAMEVMAGAVLLFGAEESRLFEAPFAPSNAPVRRLAWAVTALLLAFALVGALPWALESAIPPHFASRSPEALAAQVDALLAEVDEADMTAFLAQPEAVIFEGRTLYPRFYRRHLGVASAHPWEAYRRRDFPRLGFLMLHEGVKQVILPTKTLPRDFPHWADAVVLGCEREGYVEARLVVFPQEGKVYASGGVEAPCAQEWRP
ncbi:MAG: hypothetical protein D6770_05580 [Anaerolineae bacterium]|nr:MAG: hypothetical protein D6770_05580 [Anaerolineae bacterium]